MKKKLFYRPKNKKVNKTILNYHARIYFLGKKSFIVIYCAKCRRTT